MADSHSLFSFNGRVARQYDRFNHWASLGLDLLWRDRTARLIQKDSRGNSGTILDLACGTGDMAIAVSRRNPDAIVIGIDPSEDMLRLCRGKINGSFFSKIQIVNGAGKLPFKDDGFDAVTCAFGIRNFIRLAEGIQEIRRTLRPGGRLYLLEFFSPPNIRSRVMLALLRRTIFPVLGWILIGGGAPYRYLAKSIENFITIEAMEYMLESKGWEGLYSRSFSGGLAQLLVAEKPETRYTP